MGREDVRVQHQHARGAEALPGRTVVPQRREPPARDEGQTEQGPERDPEDGRDEIILKGVVHEKYDCEEEDEAAQPGEEFDT